MNTQKQTHIQDTTSDALPEAIADKRHRLLTEVERARHCQEMPPELDTQAVLEMACALEILVLKIEMDSHPEDTASLEAMRCAAKDAFLLWQILPLPKSPMAAAEQLVRAFALAIIGGCDSDAAHWMRELEEARVLPVLPLESWSWGVRCKAVMANTWLRLLCNQGQLDREAMDERASTLRDTQKVFERGYLGTFEPMTAKRAALELIAMYHMLKAAEILSLHTAKHTAQYREQSRNMLKQHFGYALKACSDGCFVELEFLVNLIRIASEKLAQD